MQQIVHIITTCRVERAGAQAVDGVVAADPRRPITRRRACRLETEARATC